MYSALGTKATPFDQTSKATLANNLRAANSKWLRTLRGFSCGNSLDRSSEPWLATASSDGGEMLRLSILGRTRGYCKGWSISGTK